MAVFTSVQMFVASFSIVYMLSILTDAFGRGVYTTIERRFQVTTKKIASLSIAYQVANLLFLVIVSYYGRKCHRPRVVGGSCLLVAISFFFITIPHFVSDKYDYTIIDTNDSTLTDDTSQLCSLASTHPMPSSTVTSQCDIDDSTTSSGISGLYWMVVVGYALCGVGGSTFYPLAFSYVDDVDKESSLYIAIINTAGLLGNVLGYAMCGVILKLWIDFERIQPGTVDLKQEDPRWIGPWWLGFAIGGILTFLFSIPLFFFPKSNGNDEKTDEELDEGRGLNEMMKEDENIRNGREWKEMCKGPLATFKRMFMNPVYVFTITSGTLCIATQITMIAFSPKYFEVSFGISASNSGYIFGAAVLPCSGLAVIISGIIIKKMKLESKGTLTLCLVSVCGSSVCLLLLCFVGCHTIDVRGVTATYTGQDISSPIHECNTGCDCQHGTFAPVCGSDDVTYLSPCHAGCSSAVGDTQNFTDCACVEGNSTATGGACELSKCPHLFILVVALQTAAAFFSSMVITPFMMVILRTVPPEDKSVGIGISAFMVRVAGLIPSRIILAAAIDSTCLYWSDGGCGDEGYCKIYDNSALRKSMFGILFLYQAASVLTTGLAKFFEARERRKKKQKRNAEKKEIDRSKLI